MNGATDITIQGNKIGTTEDGLSGLGNQGSGIFAEDVVTMQLGGDTPEERNIIADNGYAGIEIEEGENYTIQGNYIGTDASGSVGLGNEGDGVLVEEGADIILIGGPNSGEGNVISASKSADTDGIRIDGVWGDKETEIDDVTIQGNMVGVTADGTAALGNNNDGVHVNGVNTLLIDQNLISGNGAGGSTGRGIYLTSMPDDNEIKITGNYIGTDIGGNNALPNDGIGLWATDVSNVLIGGPNVSDRNIVSANNGDGISISGDFHTIRGNYVGIGADGSTQLGNEEDGIDLGTDSTQIGGTGAGEANIIAYNGGSGVNVDINTSQYSDPHLANAIRRNRIFGNARVGIDLQINESGPPDSTNTQQFDFDTDDADSGPNNLQNHPEITEVDYNDSTTEMMVAYSVPTAVANAAYPLTVEFFRSDDSHQAFSYLGSDQVPSGEALSAQTATFVVENEYTVQDYVVATVIDADGNTSEIGIIKQQSPSYTVPGDQEIIFTHEFGHPDVYTSFKFSSVVSHDVEYDGFSIEHLFTPEQNEMPSLPQNTEQAMEGSWRYYYDNSNPHDGSICFNLNKLLDPSQQLNSLTIYESTKLSNSREGWKNIGSFIQGGPDGDSYVCGYVDHRTNANNANYYDYIVVNSTSSLAYISIPGPNEGWRMISSPAANTTLNGLLGEFWTQGIPGSDAPGGSPTVYYWDETSRSFATPSSMSEVMDPGKGYIAYIYDDQDFDGTDEGFPKTLTATGEEHPALSNVSVTANDTGTDGINGDEGWNLVSNPFSVSIKVDKVLDAARSVNSNMNANVYIWDPNKEGGAGYQIHAEETGEVIAPFQAFWIRYLQDDVSGSLSMNKSELKGSGGNFFKEQSKQSQVVLTLKHGELSDNFILRFDKDESVKTDLDLSDGYQLQPLTNHYVQFYTLLSQNEPVAVNRIPYEISNTVKLPLALESTSEQDKTVLRWTVDHIPDDIKLILKDKKTGKAIPIDGQGEYSFSLNPAKTVSDSSYKMNKISFQNSFTSSAKSKTDTRFALKIVPGNEQLASDLPKEVQLDQNYPNPFNPTTVIRYGVPEQANVQLSIFNILGQRVARLINSERSPGHYEVNFDASGLSSGLYFYRLQAGEKTLTKKMMLIK